MTALRSFLPSRDRRSRAGLAVIVEAALFMLLATADEPDRTSSRAKTKPARARCRSR